MRWHYQETKCQPANICVYKYSANEELRLLFTIYLSSTYQNTEVITKWHFQTHFKVIFKLIFFQTHFPSHFGSSFIRCVLHSALNKTSAFVQQKAWHRALIKPLSALMMAHFIDTYMHYQATMNYATRSWLVLNKNKANLSDLIAATGLVILLKLDSNRQFLSPCDGWPQKRIRHPFYTTSSFVYHFKTISEFKLEL